MHDERRKVYRLQICGEVGLRERFDAVVMRVGAAHHPLPPPVVDHGFGHVCAWTVLPIERATRDIPVELRAIGRELLPETIEHLDRQAAGLADVFTMIGGSAPMSTSLATRPSPCRAA